MANGDDGLVKLLEDWLADVDQAIDDESAAAKDIKKHTDQFGRTSRKYFSGHGKTYRRKVASD